MSRRGTAEKKIEKSDPIYRNRVVNRLINHIMKHIKKLLASRKKPACCCYFRLGTFFHNPRSNKEEIRRSYAGCSKKSIIESDHNG